jgi:hypothetical protein
MRRQPETVVESNAEPIEDIDWNRLAGTIMERMGRSKNGRVEKDLSCMSGRVQDGNGVPKILHQGMSQGI